MCSPISDRPLRAIPPLRGYAGSLALLLLAGCSGGDGRPADRTIACRLPGETGFADVCRLDSMATPEGMVLTVRQPDGAFRRLLVVKDGRGVIAADGAEAVRVTSGQGDSIDVEVAGAIYRLPAKIAP